MTPKVVAEIVKRRDAGETFVSICKDLRIPPRAGGKDRTGVAYDAYWHAKGGKGTKKAPRSSAKKAAPARKGRT
jgi:hypothetical protein